MLFPGTRTERASLLATVISTVVAVLAFMWGVYAYLKPPAATPESSTANTAQPVPQLDERSRAQALRAVANSFRALSAERVRLANSIQWREAETTYQRASELYAIGQFTEAAASFDKAQQEFNDVNSNAVASSDPNAMTPAPASIRLEEYIKKLDLEIAKLERDKSAAAPLEAGAPENEVMQNIEAQIRSLRDTKSEAQRRLIIALGS